MCKNIDPTLKLIILCFFYFDVVVLFHLIKRYLNLIGLIDMAYIISQVLQPVSSYQAGLALTMWNQNYIQSNRRYRGWNLVNLAHCGVDKVQCLVFSHL